VSINQELQFEKEDKNVGTLGKLRGIAIRWLPKLGSEAWRPKCVGPGSWRNQVVQRDWRQGETERSL